ncbi:lytic transglycosylase domain-containing protein [bacterium]|nr:lytic transglycosylase domain-containing protein [bacterium]
MRRVTKIGLVSLIMSVGMFAASHRSLSQEETQVLNLAQVIAKEAKGQAKVSPYGLSRDVLALSKEYNIDPLLITSLIKVESSFNPQAKSQVGAIGLMQTMPALTKQVGHETGVKNADDLWDQKNNLKTGVHYFSYLLNKYNYDTHKALTAYNMGPGNLNKAIKAGKVPNIYAGKVLKNYKKFMLASNQSNFL